MKKLLFINIFLLICSVQLWSQCMCNLDLQPNPNDPTGCCYFLTMETDACSGVSFGAIGVNTAFSPINPCEIASVNSFGVAQESINSTNDFVSFTPLGGWNNVPNVPLTVAEICFTNGSALSLVNVTMEGFDNSGTLVASCPNFIEVDATCASNPILDCTCQIDYLQTAPCCYEVGVTFTGMDCPTLNFQTVDINTATVAANPCELLSVSPANGIVTGPFGNGNTTVVLGSSFNLGNTNQRQAIADICVHNGINPLSAVEVSVSESSNAVPGCMDVLEWQATCIPPTPLDKLMGDQDDNIPIKVISVGTDKMQILANVDRNGVNYGTLTQYDLATQTKDWDLESPPDIFYSDVAYHPIVKRSYIIGFTLPVAVNNVLQDNKSVISVIDQAGQCDKVVTHDMTGREQLRKILYHPNPNNPKYDLYITGAKNATSTPTALDDLIVFNMDDNCQINWFRKINHTGDDEMYRGIVPRPNGDGVIIVGNDSSNNRGVWVEYDHQGNQLRSRIHNVAEDIYDGHLYTNGDLLLVGSNQTQKEAVITLTDVNHSYLSGLRFPDLKEFQELVFDGQFFWTVAQLKNGTTPENHIVKFHVTGNNIIIDERFKVENGELDFKLGSINTHPSGMILYADGRIPQSGSGDFEMYVAAYDQTVLQGDCVSQVSPNNSTYIISTSSTSITTDVNQTLPPDVSAGSCNFLNFTCNSFCVPTTCEALFSWQQKDCHKIQFTNLSTAIPVATYEWDMDNDGITDVTTTDPCYDFQTPGTYFVCMTVFGADGCSDTFCDSVVVAPETVDPVISCPANISLTVPACQRGSVATWNPVTAVDDCGPVTVTCSHQSGDFFPCGQTTVTCTATDSLGNTSTCSFIVSVNCECAETAAQDIECTPNPDQFYFSFIVNDLTKAQSCSANISLPGNIGNLNIATNNWNAGVLFFDGTIDATAYPFPQNFSVQIDFACICPDQLPYNCTHLVNFVTPCCDKASIDTAGICKVADEYIIDIDFFGTVNDIIQVDYFVQDAPCPTTPWGGIPFQSTIGYQPLKLLPRYHSQDVCIYAVVTLGGNERPCTVLTTNIAELTLCSPYNCSLGSQEFCFMGSPITPAPITFNGPFPDCDYTIEWYDPQGNLINLPAGTTTYQPPALSYTNSLQDCSQSYIYEMRIDGACGLVSCQHPITLWNDQAPVGDLYLDPIENLPLCYGEDVSIRYDENCALPSDLWDWKVSTDGSTFNGVPGVGNRNPYINSNRLFQDHWYSVERTNGVCPADTAMIYIPVKDPLMVSSFTADPLDPCLETGVKLGVQYSPCVPSLNSVCDCDFTIDWYKNGILIGSSNSNAATGSYTYVDPALNGNYGGVYYAVVRDNCCGDEERSSWKIIDPPIGLCIIGDCFICDPAIPVVLNGVVKNGPPIGNCTYQWYSFTPTIGWQIIGGATSTSWTTNKAGMYRLEMTCIDGNTTCVKTADFEVMDCLTVGLFEITAVDFDFTLAPNPTDAATELRIDGDIDGEVKIGLYNSLGQSIDQYTLGSHDKMLRIEYLNPGIYLVRMETEDQGVLTKQLIVQ